MAWLLSPLQEHTGSGKIASSRCQVAPRIVICSREDESLWKEEY